MTRKLLEISIGRLHRMKKGGKKSHGMEGRNESTHLEKRKPKIWPKNNWKSV